MRQLQALQWGIRLVKDIPIRALNPGMLNLAMACRKLYTTSVALFFTNTDFLFVVRTNSVSIMPLAPEVFLKQIGPTNISFITKVSLISRPPIEELPLLSQLPQLREMHVTLLDVQTRIEDVFKLRERLRALHSELVLPSLRSLRV